MLKNYSIFQIPLQKLKILIYENLKINMAISFFGSLDFEPILNNETFL
jgi:hypothetical protein